MAAHQFGNTASNIINGGAAALYEGRIYFYQECYADGGLFSMDTDGNEPQRLDYHSDEDIAIVGSWLFLREEGGGGYMVDMDAGKWTTWFNNIVAL